MTTNHVDQRTVRTALALAARAPSIHNSQPWRWVLGPRSVHLYADLRRWLPATDAQGRDTAPPGRPQGRQAWTAARALAPIGARGSMTGIRQRARRWLYGGGRPNRLARVMNRADALLYSTGILLPGRLVTLEVPGRRTGRLVSVPLVVADHDGERYLVAMLGEDCGWVRNVRAAGGQAVLWHGRREAVRLVEVDVAARAPILRRYLAVAQGARAHLPVDRRAPRAEFERVAGQVPVFRIASG